MQDRKQRMQNIGCVNCEIIIGNATPRQQTGDKIKRKNAVEVLLKSFLVFIPDPLVVPAIRVQKCSSVEQWRGDFILSSPPSDEVKTTQMAESKEILETFFSNFRRGIPWSVEAGDYAVCSNNQLHVPKPGLTTDEQILSETDDFEEY